MAIVSNILGLASQAGVSIVTRSADLKLHGFLSGKKRPVVIIVWTSGDILMSYLTVTHHSA